MILIIFGVSVVSKDFLEIGSICIYVCLFEMVSFIVNLGKLELTYGFQAFMVIPVSIRYVLVSIAIV